MTAEANAREADGGAAGDQDRPKSGRAPVYRQALPAIRATLKRFFGPGVAVLVFGAATAGLLARSRRGLALVLAGIYVVIGC